MVLWIKCLSASFLFPPSVFHLHVYIIPVLKMISLSSYVAWQCTCVTFCLDHWYFIIKWTLFTISSWDLCLPFPNLTTSFCLKTVIYLVFFKVCLNCLHCYQLTTIGLFLVLCLSEWLQVRGKTAVSSLRHQKNVY